jgi:hypothetical protein
MRSIAERDANAARWSNTLPVWISVRRCNNLRSRPYRFSRTSGNSMIKTFGFIKPRPELSHTQFIDHWTTVHTEMVKAFPQGARTRDQ